MQPGPFFRRGVRRKPARQRERLRRREDRIERSRRGRVPMVLPERARYPMRGVERDKIVQKVRIIHRASSVSHVDIPTTGIGLKREEHAARARLVIVVRGALRLARASGDASAPIGKEETRPCINVYERPARVIRHSELVAPSLHRPHNSARHGPATPWFAEPRLQWGVFTAPLTLACEIVSMPAQFTS